MGTDLQENINPRYISTISDEPKQILQPITGYAYEPLLSLEEACEPLLNIVSRLQAHIWVAKQNSKNPADGLTEDESAAIHLYTMEWDPNPNEPRGSLYVHLNRTLKLVDRTKLRPWFRFLKLFLTAVAKLPFVPRQTVWRGVRKDHSVDYPPGSEATWWAFSSCTTSLSVLESELYLGNVGTRTLFSIEAINARTVRSHSHFVTEDEILLLPGTFFEVKSRLNPAPDLHIVHLQQKIPPHTLLEPPFENAQLFPAVEENLYKSPNSDPKDNKRNRPWYKRRRFPFGAAVAALLIIFIILLAAFLGTRKKGPEPLSSTSTLAPPQYNTNITVFSPVSISYAFYPFDQSVLDLYGLRDGQMNGGAASYTQGYVGTGQAIVLNQSISTWMSVANQFNLSSTGFTIEAFFNYQNNSLNKSLIQFSSGMSMNIRGSKVEFILNQANRASSMAVISTNEWHHVAVVYNEINHYTSIYIDGILAGELAYLLSATTKNDNVTIIIGSGYDGMIDQLSISLETKTSDRILWDATVAAYYPLDGGTTGWLLDYGPNCLNASSIGTRPVLGQIRTALNFSNAGAYYQAPGFTVLNVVNHEFSVALWIRPEIQSGLFLTIANSVNCLLTLGIRSSDNSLIAYLPNATNTNTDVSIVGSVMTTNEWAHVTFTWSNANQAQLYKETVLEGRSNYATKLNNGYGESMTVTLGVYRGNANCTGGDVFDMTKQFIGSMDEFYVFSRELQQNEIQNLTQTTNS